MTGKDDSAGSGEGDRMAVAEYVLGVLDGPERDRIARAIETDPAMAAEARFWEAHLAGFNESYEPVTPPSDLLARTEARLFAPTANPAPANWFGSLVFWRAATGLALAAAIAGIGLNLFPLAQPSMPSGGLKRCKEPAEGQISAVAVYDAQAGLLRILATGAPAAEGQDYELWLVPADGTPVSVSLLTTNEPHAIPLGEAHLAQLAEGVTFAVSLEPQGGSPTGLPTGPVLAAGVSAPI
jgi:anti-sigma-K factor RskA